MSIYCISLDQIGVKPATRTIYGCPENVFQFIFILCHKLSAKANPSDRFRADAGQMQLIFYIVKDFGWKLCFPGVLRAE